MRGRTGKLNAPDGAYWKLSKLGSACDL